MNVTGRVLVGVSAMLLLALCAVVALWRNDRARRAVRFAEKSAAMQRTINELNVQLHREREDRRALEGYYILDDSANLDEEWGAEMAYAFRQLEANDPEGTHS